MLAPKCSDGSRGANPRVAGIVTNEPVLLFRWSGSKVSSVFGGCVLRCMEASVGSAAGRRSQASKGMKEWTGSGQHNRQAGGVELGSDSE